MSVRRPHMPSARTRAPVAMAWCAALVLMAASPPLHAQSCAAMDGADAALQQIDPQERVDWLSKQLEDESAAAQRWSGVWRAGYITAAAAEVALTPFQSRTDRKESYLGASSCLVGVVALTVSPLDVTEDGKGQRARTAEWARSEGLCAALARVERRVIAHAANERSNKGWLNHTGNAAFNILLGALFAFGLHDKTAGVVNLVAGTAVGELMINTQPDRLTDVLHDYRAGHLDTPAPAWLRLMAAAPTAGPGLALAF